VSPDEPEQPAAPGQPSADAEQPPDEVSLEPGMPTPGPAWHRTPIHPEGGEPPEATIPAPAAGEPVAAAPVEPPQPPAPPAAAVEVPSAPPPSSGAHLAAGVFLTVGGLSIIAGFIGIISAQDIRFPANATACGIAFAVFFFLAVALRPSVGMDGMRATLGVVSVVFLTACFVYAVEITGTISDQSFRVKVAAAAAVFTVGMGVVGVVVPSAVAGGLAVLGVEAAVLLSVVAAGGASVTSLGVSALVAAVCVLLVVIRVPLIRPHPRGLAWMVSVGAVLAVLPASEALGSFNGLAAASSGLLALALVVIAWRHRMLVPAIATVPAILTVEGYAIAHAATSATDVAVGLMVVGIVVLLVIAVAGAAVRGRVRTRSTPPVGLPRALLPEELLLVAAAVLALVSLGTSSATPFPFLQGSGSSGSEPFITQTPFPPG